MKALKCAWKILLIVVALSLIFMIGCGSNEKQSDGAYGTRDYDSVMMDDVGPVAEGRNEYESGGTHSSSGIISGDKIIYRQDIHLETEGLMTTIERIREDLDILQGFIQDYHMSHQDDFEARAYMTIRVPTDRREDFVSRIREHGKIKTETLESVNVSDEYYDMEANLRNLKIQERRLLELLEEASTLSDILTLESELSRIRREIERITGYLQRLDDRIQYSTISLSIKEVEDTETPDQAFWDQLVDRFKESFSTFAEISGKILLIIAGYFPFVMVGGILIAVFYTRFLRGSFWKRASRNDAEKSKPSKQRDGN